MLWKQKLSSFPLPPVRSADRFPALVPWSTVPKVANGAAKAAAATDYRRHFNLIKKLKHSEIIHTTGDDDDDNNNAEKGAAISKPAEAEGW